MGIKIFKTFIQAALGAFFSTLSTICFTDVEGVKAGLIAAAGAAVTVGVCAVMNMPQVAAWFNYYGEAGSNPDPDEVLPQ